MLAYCKLIQQKTFLQVPHNFGIGGSQIRILSQIRMNKHTVAFHGLIRWSANSRAFLISFSTQGGWSARSFIISLPFQNMAVFLALSRLPLVFSPSLQQDLSWHFKGCSSDNSRFPEQDEADLLPTVLSLPTTSLFHLHSTGHPTWHNLDKAQLGFIA